jgi:N-acetylmuramoyl-L-alanine amidase
MSKQYKYLVLHCMASKPSIVFTRQNIIDLFKNIGWKKVGYRNVINQDGTVFSFTENNGDQFIQTAEITNGVRGFNDISQHISYAGGVDDSGKPKDTRTLFQYLTMIDLILKEIKNHPQIKVVGHNQFVGVIKACPSFNVPSFLDEISDKERLKKKLQDYGASKSIIDKYLLLNIKINEANISRSTIYN